MKIFKIVLTFAATSVLAGTAAADQAQNTLLGFGNPAVCGSADCCAACGRHCACQPMVCQLQCGMKTEKKHTWCVECEEFCTLLPGKRERCCERCGDTCDGQCCANCCKSSPAPRCGRPKCVQKLVKKEYDVEVPVYKCVLRYLCGDCCAREGSAMSLKLEGQASAIPPAPLVPEAPVPPQLPAASPAKAPPPTTAKAPKGPSTRKGQSAPKAPKTPTSKPAKLQSIGDPGPDEQ